MYRWGESGEEEVLLLVVGDLLELHVAAAEGEDGHGCEVGVVDDEGLGNRRGVPRTCSAGRA